MPYYNHYFTKYNYTYPAEGEEFNVHVEPHQPSLPDFVTKILQLAFPNRKIIINNDIKPNLIIRWESLYPKLGLTEDYTKWNAPYISLSAERWSLSRRRYRLNGVPLAEFVSATPTSNRQLYFPFMTWCGLKPERVYKNQDRNKFLIYIASNCVKQRERLFKSLQDKMKLKIGQKDYQGPKDFGLEGWGSCSNTSGEKLAGAWEVVEHKYSEFNFAFAMENRQISGYMTEKILAVFRGGAIPVFWGDSELAAKYFNPKAFVDVGKFTSLEEVADYLIKLNDDQDRVRQMQKEPIFKDGVVPEIFKMNDSEPSRDILQAAAFIKAEFEKEIARNKT